MLQFKTISNSDPHKVDNEEFVKFREFLKSRYPLIHEVSTFSLFERGMLFHIKGESHDKPIVFMSHYDVVPINGTWKGDPFSGKN